MSALRTACCVRTAPAAEVLCHLRKALATAGLGAWELNMLLAHTPITSGCDRDVAALQSSVACTLDRIRTHWHACRGELMVPSRGQSMTCVDMLRKAVVQVCSAPRSSCDRSGSARTA